MLKSPIIFCSIACLKGNDVPVIGDRSEEPRFMLGRLASSNEKPLDCLFENELGTPSRLQLPMVLNQGVRNQAKNPLYRLIEGHIPYLIWYREGKEDERSTKRFMKLARQLRRSSTLVIDVREITTVLSSSLRLG